MERVKTTLLIALGNFILALGVAAFIIPINLVSGGTTGLALLIHQLSRVRVSYVVFGLDFVMLIYGLILLGKKFALGTLLSSFLYPFFLHLLEEQPLLQSLTDDPMLCSVFGGILSGIGVGIVFRVGASTGGTDPVALSLHKYFHISISAAMYGTDLAVIAMQAYFSNTERVLYGIFCVLISSFVVERVSTIGESNVQVLTISQKSQEICDAILIECNLGATLIPIKTGYTGEESYAVMSVTHRRFLKQLQNTIISIDPTAFMQITEVASVHGRGFTLERYMRDDREEQKKME